MAFLLSIPSYLKSRADDQSVFWRPNGKDAAQKLRKRAEIALSGKIVLFTWPLFLPSVLVLLLLTSLTWGTGTTRGLLGMRLDVVAGYLLGAGLAMGAAYALGLRHAIDSNLQAIATQACKAMARRGVLSDAEELLAQASQQPQARLRLGAAIALRYLGTTTGNEILQKLMHDPDEQVASKARNSLENIEAILSGQGRRSVIPLNQTMIDYNRMDSMLEATVDNTHRESLMADHYRLRNVFEETVFSQLPLRRSFPYLFCMDCHCRAEEVVYKDWAWVRCKRCKDVFGLKPGVVVVTGQVGGVDAWELRNGDLKLSLWNAEDRKARGAEIDVLEIVGGKDIDYDWAVSAVIEQLRAFLLHGEPKAHVKYLYNPTLSLNTMKLLRIVDKAVAVGE